VSHQKLGFVATVCPDNTPNLSPKGTVSVWDDEHIVFANIKSPQTMENLQKNPSIEINVVDPIKRKGYRFKGLAKILSEGNEFNMIQKYYKDSGVKSEFQSVALIKVDSIKEITSPQYDLGYSEEEIITKWKKHYFSF